MSPVPGMWCRPSGQDAAVRRGHIGGIAAAFRQHLQIADGAEDPLGDLQRGVFQPKNAGALPVPPAGGGDAVHRKGKGPARAAALSEAARTKLSRMESIRFMLLPPRFLLYDSAERSPLEKTVIYLLQYCETAPHEPGSPYVVQKTRTEISSEAFFSLKTLERCLYRLRDAGMLSIAKGKVYISEEQRR